MKKVSNFDVFLVIWAGAFGLWEVFKLINDTNISAQGFHILIIALQFAFCGIAIKNIIEALQSK